MQSALVNLQNAMARRLNRRKDFSAIPVLIRQNGSISANIKESIAQRGLCVVIMPPRPFASDASQGTPVFTEVRVCVRVIESAFQRHNEDALGVAEMVSRVLHGWKPAVVGITTPIALDDEYAWSMDEEPDKKGRFVIEVNFTTSASI